jgi:hypothetical protein
MKWDVLKKKIAADVYTMIVNNGEYQAFALLDMTLAGFAPKKGVDSRMLILQYADIAEKFVLKWDIRMIGKLRDLFPGLFPKSLKEGTLVPDIDNNGDWVVGVRK